MTTCPLLAQAGEDVKQTIGDKPSMWSCESLGPCGVKRGHCRCVRARLQGTSAGAKDQEADNFLEKRFKNDPQFSFEETVQTAIAALQNVLSEDFKATEIEVSLHMSSGGTASDVPAWLLGQCKRIMEQQLADRAGLRIVWVLMRSQRAQGTVLCLAPCAVTAFLPLSRWAW